MVKILFFQSLYPVAFPLNTSELFFLMENLEKYITHRMLLRKASFVAHEPFGSRQMPRVL